MTKKVYIAISADILHHGHINLIKTACKLGELTVGVLTDDAIASYKRYPLLNLEERMFIISNIAGVSRVIVQKTIDYKDVLHELKPNYVVHGDDWKEGPQKDIRQRVINILDEWNGELVEIPYTKDITIENINSKLDSSGKMPEIRRSLLSKLLQAKPLVRVMEAHNGLTGLIAESTKVYINNVLEGFDGIWISSLCDSTIKGKPDIELVDMTSRLTTINEIMEVTTKPIILDGDSGGLKEHFAFNVKTLERVGVSAVIIEDKIGLKRNSLFGVDSEQVQDDKASFCEKIKAGCNSINTNEFMIIARIESLILGIGIEDAIDRAKEYIKAGAHGIMIHSNKKTPEEVFEFCKRFRMLTKEIPLVLVPTTYNTVREDEFIEKGANLVIYANHLIRSAYPAMKKTAESILRNKRSFEADEYCMNIKEILTLIPT